MKISCHVRIIPTRVGTSFCKCSKRQVSRDHPHACGDKSTQDILTCTAWGSSPRVWGQGYLHLRNGSICGIIPTRVGTRLHKLVLSPNTQDHPHACGDKKSLRTNTMSSKGSSPRVWGQVTYGQDGKSNIRIIPTRVGTSYPKCGKTTED